MAENATLQRIADREYKYGFVTDIESGDLPAVTWVTPRFELWLVE